MTLKQEFRDGPIKEICNEKGMTFQEYKNFCEYFHLMVLFQLKASINKAMKKAMLEEKRAAEERRNQKLAQADKEQHLPWQQALKITAKSYPMERMKNRQYPRVYSKKDETAWKKCQA